jgi:hypothetical protein
MQVMNTRIDPPRRIPATTDPVVVGLGRLLAGVGALGLVVLFAILWTVLRSLGIL